jgi:hypothetical protein
MANHNTHQLQLASRLILMEQIAANMTKATQTAVPKLTTPVNVKKASPEDIAKGMKRIAQEIYNSKGVFNDDESKVVKAIQKIQNKQQFELVQKELQKLTGGKGIGQYVTGFIEIGGSGPQADNTNTLKFTTPIIKHLQKIQANPKTIELFNKLQKSLQVYAKQEDDFDKALGGPGLRQFWEDYHHEILTVAEVGALFIPYIGPYVSAGIAMADAKMYYDEGDKYTAGLIVALTLTAGTGSVIAKIPGVRKLNAKIIKSIAKKLTRLKNGEKVVFTATERPVVTGVAKNPNLINKEVRAYTKRVARNKKIVKATGRGTAAAAAYKGGTWSWDNIYVNTGIQLSDIEGQNKSDIDRLIAYADTIDSQGNK